MTADEDLLQRAEAFAREVVAPAAPRWEAERRIGLEALQAAAYLGLTGIEVPVAWGGLGLGYGSKARVAERLAAADFGFTMSLLNTHNVAAKLARDAPALAGRYLPDLLSGQRLGCTALTEPGAGSDFGAIRTQAVRTPQGWRLDGAKAWITNAARADVIVLYAQTEAGSGGRGIACFLIDGTRPGFVREPAYQLSGQHAIGAGGFRLDGYLASDDELLHPPGQAFKAALRSINGARVYIAAMCNGMVGEALRIAQAYGAQRQAFGQPLAGHQGWRWRRAEAATELQAARLLVAQAAEQVESGADAQLLSAQAKLFATRMAERQLPALAQAMGAEGLREVHPFGRHQAGARVASFVDGSSEMLLERIAALQRAATPLVNPEA
ncbi:MAG: acyl-CoA/acyl-ACP dehydrogenase [Burkholderiales bacterium]|nr:acyl-CoA/acyl-ACP dehydrogenase [Burkholderiales bacterium]